MNLTNEISKVHCMFEQSGTFKQQFIAMGIPAVDYDLRDNFGQTDFQIDLFNEIERGYKNESSVFDNIEPSDLIMAFFPCIYFEALQMTYYTTDCNNLKNKSDKEKFDIVIKRIEQRERFYILLYKLVAIAKMRSLRLIIENPATQPHYLLFSENFIKPTFIDNNRQRRGDYFRKPTAYWFINIERTFGESYVTPKETRRVQRCKSAITGGGYAVRNVQSYHPNTLGISFTISSSDVKTNKRN